MISEKKVMGHFKDIKEVLDACAVKFWLEDGTLLGAVRDGRMIPWDHDIDIGAFATSFNESVKKKMTNILIKKGFSVYFFPYSVSIHRGNFHTDIILLRYSEDGRDFVITRFLSRNKVSHLLVKLHKLSKASMYSGPRIKNLAGARDLIKGNLFFIMGILPGLFKTSLYKFFRYLLGSYEKTSYFVLSVPAKHFRFLEKINYGGHIVNIPSFAEEYLEKKYGDWRTQPKDPSKWKWYEVGEWPIIEQPLDRKKVNI